MEEILDKQHKDAFDAQIKIMNGLTRRQVGAIMEGNNTKKPFLSMYTNRNQSQFLILGFEDMTSATYATPNKRGAPIAQLTLDYANPDELKQLVYTTGAYGNTLYGKVEDLPIYINRMIAQATEENCLPK